MSDGRKLDVAILGGGLAGQLLARQLRRTLPSLAVGVFDKATATSFKVGESFVELASNYLIRRQGLSRYLFEHHLPKNGLRYFFDDADRATELTAMSEIGPVHMPFHPGFQIDRARMEADLQAMNRRAGVQVENGVTVRAPILGEGGAAHTFETVRGTDVQRYSCRWLVDATGRASLLAHAKDLRVREEEHRIGAVWGRFADVVDVDELGPPAFRERVRHSSRRLSTMHFWYAGYWIWFIPLRGGLTSIGAVGDLRGPGAAARTAPGFRAFLDEHRAVASLLADARAVDVGSSAQIAYGTRRFFHADRWGLIGEAATAADPLYSPGSDFIALENDFLTDLIRRDVAGERADALAERTDLYDRFMKFRHEAVMLLYRGVYGVQGSYEIMRLKWDLDLGCYYNLWLAPYLLDAYLDADFLRQQLRQQRFVLQALRNFATLLRQLDHELRARGEYFRANAGRFSNGLERIDFVQEVGLPRSRREVLQRTAEIFNTVRGGALALLAATPPPTPVAALPLTSFMVERSLA